MRTCLFCGTGKPTRAHAIPEWLAVYLGAGRVEITTDSTDGHRRRKSTDSFDVVVKCVCKSCNERWLSDIENAAKPIVVDLVDGRPRKLTNDDQLILARWIWPIALLFARSTPDRFFDARDFAEFKAKRQPPDAVDIRLISYSGPNRPGRTEMRTAGSKIGGVSVGRMFVLTMQLGALAVEVFNFRIPTTTDMTLLDGAYVPIQPGFERDLVTCWPTGADFPWPTARAIGDSSYFAFRDRIIAWKDPSNSV